MEEINQTNKHYTYYSQEEFEEGRGYIGVRTAQEGLAPQEDIRYWSSYKQDGTFNPNNKIREVSLEEITFPITAEQLLFELQLTMSSSDTKRLIWGTTIMLDNDLLNTNLSTIVFQKADELRGKSIKIGKSKVVKMI